LRLLSPAESTDVGAYRGARSSTTGRGDILTASATDLMTENAADNGSRDGPGNTDIASLLSDLLALDPAFLLRCGDHRPN
jgi:hypothetical protein